MGLLNTRPVTKLNKKGEILQEYTSIRIASIENEIEEHAIRTCCTGERVMAGGFVWRYKGETFPIKMPKRPRKPVTQLSECGKIVKTHKTIAEASRFVGVSKYYINSCAKGKRELAGGFKWIYIDDDQTQ
jgi:hypothetical protein